jgi:hypothetical protein
MSFSENNIALSFGGKCKEYLSVNQEEYNCAEYVWRQWAIR